MGWLLWVASLSACVQGEDKSVQSPTINVPVLPDKLAQKAADPGKVLPIREFRIALTGELRGEVQPCGCPTLPYGGFARRSIYLSRLAAEGFAVFQVDAGEALLKGVSQHGRTDAERRAQAILEMMAVIGVDAMAVGPTDLIAYETLQGLKNSESAGVWMLSGGWESPHNTPLRKSRDSVVLEEQGVRLGLIGLSGESTAPELESRYARRDLVEFAKAQALALGDDLDLIVGVGSLSPEETVALSREVPAIGLLLTTAGSQHQPPRRHNSTVVVEVPPRGRYVTTLRIMLGSAPGQPLLFSGMEVEAYEELNNRRAQSLQLGDSLLTQEKKDALKSQEAEVQRVAAGLNLVTVEDRPLGTVFSGASPVDAYMEEFFEDLIVDAEAEAQKKPEPEQAAEVFANTAACVSCHVQAFAQWSFSAHKSATTTLAQEGAHKNPECLSCHTTGFGQKGGFGEPTPFNLGRYGGVQCEACHGPLAGHPEDKTIRPAPITKETCTGCHDEANSPDFVYENYHTKVRCDRGQ